MVKRQVLFYLKKEKEKRPRSKILIEMAKTVGIDLPSPKEIISELKKRGIAYTRISYEIYGNYRHYNSFHNADLGHSLTFKTYKKLLEYAYRKGVIKKRINLEEVYKKILSKYLEVRKVRKQEKRIKRKNRKGKN